MHVFEIKCQRFTDSINLDTDYDLLKLVDTETKISTPKCLIKGSDGMFWWVTLVILPANDDICPSLELQLHVSKVPVKAFFTVLSASGFKKQHEHVFKTDAQTPFCTLLNIDEHVTEGQDHKFRLTFDAVFQTAKPVISEANGTRKNIPVLQRVHESFHEPDAELVVGFERIKGHRDYLSLISPVFETLFRNETLSPSTNVIEINSAAPNVVMMIIKFCYGKKFDVVSAAELNQMYKFAKEYKIQAVMDEIDLRRS